MTDCNPTQPFDYRFPTNDRQKTNLVCSALVKIFIVRSIGNSHILLISNLREIFGIRRLVKTNHQSLSA